MFGLEPTPFDVRLVAFRIPIRVQPSFWIISVLLSLDLESPDLIFLWVGCLFVSILVHELGHALIAEALGWPSEIVLYWCGGLALSQRYSHRTPWREMAVSLAGPCAGFGLYGLVVAVQYFLLPPQVLLTYPYLLFCLIQLKWINLYWGLVNLLPVLPLDGGHVCRSICELARARDSQRLAIRISIPVAAAVAAYFFSMDSRFAGMLFAMLCLQNTLTLQQTSQSPW